MLRDNEAPANSFVSRIGIHSRRPATPNIFIEAVTSERWCLSKNRTHHDSDSSLFSIFVLLMYADLLCAPFIGRGSWKGREMTFKCKYFFLSKNYRRPRNSAPKSNLITAKTDKNTEISLIHSGIHLWGALALSHAVVRSRSVFH